MEEKILVSKLFIQKVKSLLPMIRDFYDHNYKTLDVVCKIKYKTNGEITKESLLRLYEKFVEENIEDVKSILNTKEKGNDHVVSIVTQSGVYNINIFCLLRMTFDLCKIEGLKYSISIKTSKGFDDRTKFEKTVDYLSEGYIQKGNENCRGFAGYLQNSMFLYINKTKDELCFNQTNLIDPSFFNTTPCRIYINKNNGCDFAIINISGIKYKIDNELVELIETSAKCIEDYKCSIYTDKEKLGRLLHIMNDKEDFIAHVFSQYSNEEEAESKDLNGTFVNVEGVDYDFDCLFEKVISSGLSIEQIEKNIKKLLKNKKPKVI